MASAVIRRTLLADWPIDQQVEGPGVLGIERSSGVLGHVEKGLLRLSQPIAAVRPGHQSHDDEGERRRPGPAGRVHEHGRQARREYDKVQRLLISVQSHLALVLIIVGILVVFIITVQFVVQLIFHLGKAVGLQIGSLVHFGRHVIVVLVHGRTSHFSSDVPLVDANGGPSYRLPKSKRTGVVRSKIGDEQKTPDLPTSCSKTALRN